MRNKSKVAGVIFVIILSFLTGCSQKNQIEKAQGYARKCESDYRAAVGLYKELISQGRDLEKAHLADVQDARKRDVLLAQAGVRGNRADFMILLDVVGLLSGLGGMMALGYVKAKYPEAISEGVFGALLAQLSTITSYFGLCLRDAHQFEFGSSRGSKDSNDFIRSMQR